MSWKEQTVWYTYLLLLSYYAWEKALLFFHPDSPVYLYYQMLYFFDPAYFIPYFFAFLQNISNFIFIFAVVLFIQQRKMGHVNIWRFFLGGKIFLDLVGNNYDFNMVTSYYQMDIRLGWVALLFFLAIYIPGYAALFIDSFMRKDP